MRATVAVGGPVRGHDAGAGLLRALTRIAETRPEPLQPLLDAVVVHLAVTAGPDCGAVVLTSGVPAAAAGSTAGRALEEPLSHAGVLVTAPPGATPARLGGDELALVLPGAGAGEALVVARALHERLGEPYDVDGASVLTGASIGVAAAPGHARDVTGLLRAADEAMYRAKRERTGPRTAGT
ncbi:GGDEF domain-containing protein [Kineococcus sp. SYSU DK004]|uniref:GGDEF domain-containing protein n=1 Tax=Kineococcus sp. SYSU DK004 TaxID=3383125 RepID=UPI003D7D80A6